VPVGRIAGIFGVRGELKCDPTSPGRAAICDGAELHCERPSGSSAIRLSSVRPHKGRLLIRIEGVDDADAAQTYAGAALFAPRERIALEAGEYLDADLVGCAVTGIDGREYGTVDRVEHYPASDILVVAGAMVPMVGAIVKDLDLQHRRIVIDPPAGLMSDHA
jgi:16S rRNA processing protein RimM